MARSYTKSKRAENEAETRLRIVQAALKLHTELGPARASISQIAAQAGVQRHTVYAHFPEERDLLMACSGQAAALDPMPAPAIWNGTNDPETRLRQALGALYAWYGRNATLTANVLRDAEIHPLVAEIVDLRRRPHMEAIAASLEAGLGPRGKAALALALAFHTWRSLVADVGLTPEAAVDLMVAQVLRADQP